MSALEDHTSYVCTFPCLGREVWPDDVFGRDGMSAIDELETMKEVLFNPQSGLLRTCTLLQYECMYTYVHVLGVTRIS